MEGIELSNKEAVRQKVKQIVIVKEVTFITRIRFFVLNYL